MRVLVTGGAGYIGSHATRVMLDAGFEVTVLDDLSTGHADAVDPRAELVVGSLLDTSAVTRALSGCEAVLHFAAYSIVSESCSAPLKYWKNNVGGSLSLLDAMAARGVHRLVFSSTAATYGVPDVIPIHEDAPQHPINPYGSTKLTVERAIRDLASSNPSFGCTILRYFNVAGCAPNLGERHQPETHLIPLVLDAALGRRESISIFGTDYETRDGTCIRDYIHVLDLIDAHLAALEKMQPGVVAYNVGSGRGWTVREVIDTVKRVTGTNFRVDETEPRPGDPPVLVTAPERIRDALDWDCPRSSLETIITDHWAWHSGTSAP